MLTSVSWSDFILYLTLLLIIYYGFIILIYYRSEVAEFSKSRKALYATHSRGRQVTNDPATVPLKKFKEELNEYFEGCAKLKPIPEEFIMGLRSLVQESAFVPDNKEKIILHHYITESSLKVCSIALNPGEVDRIWTR